jgi:preprotein translocase subunit YajC
VHTTLMLLHHVLAAGSSGSSGSGKKKGGSNYVFLFLIAIFALVYVIFIRPQRNRQRAAVAKTRVAQIGDEVTTTSGLIANVVAVDDDFLTLEIAPGVNCRYVPAAILRVNGADDPEPDDDTEPAPDVSNHEVISDPDEHPTTTNNHDDPTETPDEPASA